jgi:hypothetical protein
LLDRSYFQGYFDSLEFGALVGLLAKTQRYTLIPACALALCLNLLIAALHAPELHLGMTDLLSPGPK